MRALAVTLTLTLSRWRVGAAMTTDGLTSSDHRSRRARGDEDARRARGRPATWTACAGPSRAALELAWRAETHASVYATPLAEDVDRDGRGAAVTQTTSARVRAHDGATGIDLDGESWGARLGAASRGGVVRIGEAYASASLAGEARTFDGERTRAVARLAPLAMAVDWFGDDGSGKSDAGDPREVERRHEARRRAPGSRRLLDVEDEDEEEEPTTMSAEEEARSDRGWDAIDSGGDSTRDVASGSVEARRAVDGRVFVDAHALCTPAVGDVDGDGEPELVLAVSYYFDSSVRFEDDVDPKQYAATALVVLNGEDLSTKRSIALDQSAATALFKARAYAPPTLVDVDGDGRLDIVIGTYAGVLHVVDGVSGNPLPGWPRRLGQMEAQVTAADVDSDGDIELIACDVRGTVAVFKSNGVELWNKHVESRIAVAASVGDVDGDDEIEIVVGDTSGAVHAFRAKDGTAREHWPVYVGDKILAPIVLTKLRQTKRGLDVIVAAHDGVVHVLEGRSRCRDVFDIAEKIYAAPFVTSFAGFGELDVIISTMEGHVRSFKAKGSKFNALALTSSDHVSRYDYFGVALYDRTYRVIRGTYVDVVYEIIDRRVLDHAKARKSSLAPYKVAITVTSLDGFKKIVSARHDRAGRYTLRVGVPSTKTRGEIRVRVQDVNLIADEDAYSVSFHENYEIALKWLVALPFLLASAAAIRRASEDALEMDVFGASASIPTTTKGMHEE